MFSFKHMKTANIFGYVCTNLVYGMHNAASI